MSRPIITLTTDFGVSSPYIAAVKGVLLSINADVTLVDICHSIRPQDVGQAARILLETTPHYPADTVHLAVVDPGVGTDRRILYARIGNQQYVAPDNGLLGDLARRHGASKIVALTEPRYWLPHVSPTFHGRDIMAPVAARLTMGLEPEKLGLPTEDLIVLDRPEVRVLENQLEGEVVSVDSFGNLITNITRDMLQGVPVDDAVGIYCDEHETRGIFTTYADQPSLTLIALLGSSGYLELAVVDDNAAIMLGVDEGATVTVKW